MEKSARIYLAGHRGLVGSALQRALKEEGYTNVITRSHDALDLTDQVAVAAFFRSEKPDYVFLAAAKVGGIYANTTYPAEFIYNNITIQTNVLQQSHLNGVRRLLFLGSSCIYPKHAPQPIDERQLLSGPLEPTNAAYAIAKISGIQMCWAYNKQYGTQFIPVMPTNLYGPGDQFDLNTSHVLPAMIRKFHLAKLADEGKFDAILDDQDRYGPIPDDFKKGLRLDEPGAEDRLVVLWGSGTPLREFLFSDDLADGCMMIMNAAFDTLRDHATDPERLLFNLGTGKDQTIKALARLTAEVIGYGGTIAWDAGMPDGTPRKCLNVNRLQRLGWRARTDLREGIKRTYRWYLSPS